MMSSFGIFAGGINTPTTTSTFHLGEIPKNYYVCKATNASPHAGLHYVLSFQQIF